MNYWEHDDKFSLKGDYGGFILEVAAQILISNIVHHDCRLKGVSVVYIAGIDGNVVFR